MVEAPVIVNGKSILVGSNNIDIGANVVSNDTDVNTTRIGKQGHKSHFIAGISGTASGNTGKKLGNRRPN